jgi:hypothetical protein
MPKDKQGNKITWKEFLSRWKDGINGITPLQKTKTQITGTKIQLLGLFLGLIVTTIGYKNLWWVAIILLGALINTAVQYLGLSQIIETFKKIDEDSDEMNIEDLMNDEIKNQGGNR